MNEGVPVRRTDRGGQRLGTGEVEVVDVRLLNGSGAETEWIASGSSLTVEIDYVAHERVPDAIFGISAHSQKDGVRCFDVSTQSDGHVVGALDGKGTARLHVDRLDLAGGLYHIDVGVYEANWDRPYDYHWQAYPLEVVAAESPAVMAPPHRWSLD
jgi:hypothetical protein